MFKSLSSRSTRPSSHSGSSSYTHNAVSSSTYTPLPPLPPIPPTPERDIPAIRLVSATPGQNPQGSPLIEKRRTRTLVPRRSIRGKENQTQSESSFTGSLGTSSRAPVDTSLHVTGLVARQFTEQHNRQFYSVGPSTGLSFAPATDAPASLKAKSSVKSKRVLVESRAYPDGGQVEVVKDTIGRSSKPLLESVRGTITGTVKGGTVRNENGENAGTGLVVKKKKSRGTLDSIRWALGDRTNGARKAEKEKEKVEEKERKRVASQDSVAERPKSTRLTINTHVPREVPLETPITASVVSPTSTTAGTLTGNTTDNESLAAASGGEKTKWRWTIGKRRSKSPGPSLSSTFDRPAHVRSNSLDPTTLMAATHAEEPEEDGEEWPAGDRTSISDSSFAAPSTISSGSYHQSRMSRASSEAHTVRSRQDSVPAAPNVPANPGIIFEHHEEDSAPKEVATTAYLGDNAWVGVGVDTLKGRTRRSEGGAELGRRARKPVIGLFDIPSPEETQPKVPVTAPQVEVRGVKIEKGRVRDRVRAFEARVEENTGASATYSTVSAATGRKASLPVASNATSLGRAATSTVDSQRLSFIQEREYTLSGKRCVSAPLPRSSTSPERPGRSRPWSQQMSRADEEAAIDILNAANSELSDLIHQLNLTATPDANLVSPDARHTPACAEESPCRNASRSHRNGQETLTSLVGYNHPSLVKPVSSIAPRSGQKLPLANPDDLFAPASGSRALQPRPRAIKWSGSTSAKSSNGSGTRIVNRRQAGLNMTFGEDSMLTVEDADGYVADVPDELQMILSGGSEDEEPLPSPGMPPNVPLPLPSPDVEIPRVVIEDTTETQVHFVSGSDSEDNEVLERGSRKSFDFTGELGQLKGGSRNSFVEVLATAFKTPGSEIDEQLQLSVDALNRLSGSTVQDHTPVVKETATRDEATEAEISFSRAEALAKLTQPMNKKSSGQLNLDFHFASPEIAPAKRPQDDSIGTSGLADTSFALALANLTQASGDSKPGKRRDIAIRFKLDTDDMDAQTTCSHGHSCHESENSNSMSSFGNLLHSAASDPFGFNQSQSANTSRSSHGHQDSMNSIPPASSFGRLLTVPQSDPFDYEALMRELDEASMMIEDSTQALERSVSRRRRSKRMSMESDRSSFYCRANAPPVSFLNRGYGRHLGHSQNVSIEGGNSLANTGRAAWARRNSEDMTDNFTTHSYDRPGLGDKMFQAGVDHGIPLPSIMASPTNSEVSTGPQFYYEQHTGKYSYVSDQRRNSYLSERRDSYAPSIVEQRRMSFMSYDSLVDGAGDERRYSIDMESLYERRARTNSISSISIFGDDRRRRRQIRGVQPGNNFRPVSIISLESEASARDDDTMVSMIGGTGEGRVRRKSVGSTLLLDASPCFRAEKRAKQLAEARSNASTAMSMFSPNQSSSLEVFSSDSILESSPSKGKGRSHDTPRSFARPRPRPPAAMKLTADDYELDEMDMSAATPPTFALYNTRPLTVSCRKSRPMGNMTMSIARNRSSALICTAEPPDTPPLSIAGSDASSISGGSQGSIDVSKLMGMLGNSSDLPTPSGRRSRARAFAPPTYQSEIKALLEHSQDTYATLPVETYKRHHPRYSRSPRISPYPTDVTRSVKSIRTRPANVENVLSHLPPGYTPARPTRTVQESPAIMNKGKTVVHSSSPAPAPAAVAPLSPLTVNVDLKGSAVKEKGSKHSLRRTALGWGKRKTAVDVLAVPVPPSVTKTHITQSSAATVAKENLGVGMLASNLFASTVLVQKAAPLPQPYGPLFVSEVEQM
ncbi:hypothetical protein FRC07_004259 [Ceratobasidium sp. 392]|nr:hypothetical protein FRC07_004259 [Ceratobasidium sp. 392]